MAQPGVVSVCCITHDILILLIISPLALFQIKLITTELFPGCVSCTCICTLFTPKITTFAVTFAIDDKYCRSFCTAASIAVLPVELRGLFISAASVCELNWLPWSFGNNKAFPHQSSQMVPAGSLF